jgi:uncharacterized repeat protein (TIGR02543 family)
LNPGRAALRHCVFILAAAIFTVHSSNASEPSRFVPGRILVKPKSTLAEAEFSRRITGHGAVHHRTIPRTNVRVIALKEEQTDAVLSALKADPDVEYAERDYLVHPCFVPNDPYVLSGSEWHLQKIQALAAWDITAGTSSIIIAVLDSGVNAAHPDLAGHLLPGYDFVNNDSDTSDDYGHGTAVTGTLVATGNNGQGVAGVAFNCTVLPVKVMDAYGSASHSTIAQGIVYAVQNGARIINLSMGGDWNSSTLQDAINYAWSNNVVVVAAAGNTGGTAPQYPAACDNVVAVGATEPDDSRAWFSTYGSFLTLAAPGDTIWTTSRDLSNPYAGWSGTSFSSPIVAGVAALVASVNPSLSNTQLVSLLEQTADDLGSPGYDTSFGYGRVNAYGAVAAAGPQQTNSVPLVQAPPPPTPPTASLSSPSAGAQFTLGSTVGLTASASASTGAVTSVEFYANGIELASSPAPFSFNWTPAQPGTFALTVVAVDDQGLRGTSAPVAITISRAETMPPRLSFTSAPRNGARLLSPLVNFAGVAADNVGVDHVELQVNGGPAQYAQGTTNWTAQISLTPGQNVIRARSVDLAGNVSRDAVRAYTYVVYVPLSVQTNGWGSVAPNLDGSLLEIGRTYRMRAVPGPGQVFAGWTGAASQSQVLTFVMQSNLTFIANFVTNPFPVVSGNYAGLLANTNDVTPDSSGYFNLTVSASGAYSAGMIVAGQRRSWSGKLSLAGDATATIPRGSLGPLAVTMHVDMTNRTDQVAGSVTDGNWTSALQGDRDVFNGRLNPAQQAGMRAFVLQSAQDNTTAASGQSRISTGGSANVRGKLVDNRAFSTGSTLSKTGDYPFYLSLSRGKEVVIGWLNFPAAQSPAASGTVLWIQTGTNAFAATLNAASAPVPGP